MMLIEAYALLTLVREGEPHDGVVPSARAERCREEGAPDRLCGACEGDITQPSREPEATHAHGVVERIELGAEGEGGDLQLVLDGDLPLGGRGKPGDGQVGAHPARTMADEPLDLRV